VLYKYHFLATDFWLNAVFLHCELAILFYVLYFCRLLLLYELNLQFQLINSKPYYMYNFPIH